jgi:coenzyme F420-reducing hydrogenase delta subunit
VKDIYKSKTILYICHNLLLRSGLQIKDIVIPDYVEMKELPCSGRLNSLNLLKAFENNIRGILVLACPEGLCSYIDGSRRAKVRISYTRALLTEIGLSSAPISFFNLDAVSADEIAEILANFKEDIDLSTQPTNVNSGETFI